MFAALGGSSLGMLVEGWTDRRSRASSMGDEPWWSIRRPTWRSTTASVKRHRELTPLRHQELTPCFPWRERSIATVAAWRFGAGQRVEIEIDDGLQRFGHSSFMEALGKRVEPSAILGLQREQLGDGIPPASRAIASICTPGGSDDARRFHCATAGAISGLSLGVAERLFAVRVATSWHGGFFVT